MSAFGTKRTSLVAPHMSAFGGKADIPFALHMSANDPKRISAEIAYEAQSFPICSCAPKGNLF